MMSSPVLNIARWVPCTEVEGPGKRFAIWSQGCHIRCAHCCNPDYLPFVPRLFMAADDLVRQIAVAKEECGIEGITLLGGEPMIQARGFSFVARKAREFGLSVMLFTGYVVREKEKQGTLPDGATELLQHCDVVVDGPYVDSRRETRRNWVGSSNQRFHFLTNAYNSEIETNPKYANGIEIRFERNRLAINGFPFVQDPCKGDGNE